MTQQQYAISEYHNVDEIYKKLNALVAQPLHPIKREKMQEFLGYFEARCKRSKALTDESLFVFERVDATAQECEAFLRVKV